MEAGEILLKRGVLDERQLAVARQAQGDGRRLDQVAVELGLVTEEAALTALGAEMGLDYVELANTEVDLGLLKQFPTRLIYRQSLFPIARHNGSLRVATSDPFDLYALD